MSDRNILVFGATGAIGGAIAECFSKTGASIFAVSRHGRPPEKRVGPNETWLQLDEFLAKTRNLKASAFPRLDAVVWAQGANCSDDIYSFDITQHEALYEANVTYILLTLQDLIKHGLLAEGARLCVIS